MSIRHTVQIKGLPTAVGNWTQTLQKVGFIEMSLALMVHFGVF